MNKIIRVKLQLSTAVLFCSAFFSGNAMSYSIYNMHHLDSKNGAPLTGWCGRHLGGPNLNSVKIAKVQTKDKKIFVWQNINLAIRNDLKSGIKITTNRIIKTPVIVYGAEKSGFYCVDTALGMFWINSKELNKKKNNHESVNMSGEWTYAYNDNVRIKIYRTVSFGTYEVSEISNQSRVHSNKSPKSYVFLRIQSKTQSKNSFQIISHYYQKPVGIIRKLGDVLVITQAPGIDLATAYPDINLIGYWVKSRDNSTYSGHDGEACNDIR